MHTHYLNISMYFNTIFNYTIYIFIYVYVFDNVSALISSLYFDYIVEILNSLKSLINADFAKFYFHFFLRRNLIATFVKEINKERNKLLGGRERLSCSTVSKLEFFQSILVPNSHLRHRNCRCVDWFSTVNERKQLFIVFISHNSKLSLLTSKKPFSSIRLVPICAGCAVVTDCTSANSIHKKKKIKN